MSALSHTFTGTGTSTTFKVYRHNFNISISGFGSAMIEVQRSFDEGSTWYTVEEFNENTEKRVVEPEIGVLYRFSCVSYVSGSILCRFGAYDVGSV